MLERFEIPEIFEPDADVERLDRGIYLEHITSGLRSFSDVENTEVVFGETDPDPTWWFECLEEATREGFIDPDGSAPWQGLGQYFAAHGLAADYMEGVSLETLAQMLDEGEKVICAVNDLILEIPGAAMLPSVFPDQFIWVTGMDLSDPGRETVVIVKPLLQEYGKNSPQQRPLENFLKAWMTGDNRAMSVGVEG